MESFEPKKLSLFRVLQVLRNYSDINHPLTHEKIVGVLDKEYNLIVERKVIGRNIALLNDMGYDIVTTKKGSYLNSREFEDSELRLLIDGILASKFISAKHSKDLIEKLRNQSTIYFKNRTKHICKINEFNKTDKMDTFLNIDLIDEAIENNRQIKFYFTKFGANKKLRNSSLNIVSPYQMILHNQKYYLIAFNEKHNSMIFYKIDRLKDIEITDKPRKDLRQIKGYETGIDYNKITTEMPYLFTDTPVRIELIAEERAIDHIIEWFGENVAIEGFGEKFKVSLTVSPNAMEFWAMQYINLVEVVNPTSLRERIKENLSNGINKYNK